MSEDQSSSRASEKINQIIMNSPTTKKKKHLQKLQSATKIKKFGSILTPLTAAQKLNSKDFKEAGHQDFDENVLYQNDLID